MSSPPPLEPNGTSKLKLVIAVLIAVAAAETIGVVQFQVGPGKVLLQPMIWALVLAATWSLAARFLPSAVRVERSLQSFAGRLLNAGLLLFVVKMGLTVGGALPLVRQAGWGLLFQEVGHAFGTLALALPVALMLDIKREAVGATFSIGREGNLVIVADKYGMASAEGRGVLAEYITGTVLGALFIALLAGFVASLNIFDPQSLAMGAGVGSGSMMAAALGAISAQQPPEMVKQLNAIASASNLMTAILGFYLALFVTLPVCSWLYEKLEPVLGGFSGPTSEKTEAAAIDVGATQAWTLPPIDMLAAWATVAGSVIIGNAVTYKVPVLQSLAGVVLVVCIAALVEVAVRLLPRLPHILLLVVVSTVLGIPGPLPFSNALTAAAEKLNFLAFTTPLLALAGFSVAKDLPIFGQLGWRIVLVSLIASTGSFLGAALIAQAFR